MSVWSTINAILWQAVKTPLGASFASVRLVLQEMEQVAQVNMFGLINKTMQHYYISNVLSPLQQTLMSVRLELSVVIQMRSVLILMVATPAPVHLDSLEME